MNEGLQILIDRMRNNPEEFHPKSWRSSKWFSLIGEVDTYIERGFFSEEETKAFKDARVELVRKTFTADVIAVVEAANTLNEEVQEGYAVKSNIVAHTISSGGGSAGFFNTGKLQVGAVGVTESDLRIMKQNAGLK